MKVVSQTESGPFRNPDLIAAYFWFFPTSSPNFQAEKCPIQADSLSQEGFGHFRIGGRSSQARSSILIIFPAMTRKMQNVFCDIVVIGIR